MTYNEDVLVFVDIETTGLNAPKELILEVGFRVTDLDFNVLDSIDVVVGYDEDELDRARGNTVEIVQTMHEDNGLWEACENEAPNYLELVEDELVGWVEAGGWDGNPLAGSSLRTDREFLGFHMPTLHGLFHYRTIDTSTVKELCRRFNPTLFSQMPDTETDHRVATCLAGTIAETKFYADNFLFCEESD